jgi:hypothetical protein
MLMETSALPVVEMLVWTFLWLLGFTLIPKVYHHWRPDHDGNASASSSPSPPSRNGDSAETSTPSE